MAKTHVNIYLCNITLVSKANVNLFKHIRETKKSYSSEKLHELVELNHEMFQFYLNCVKPNKCVPFIFSLKHPSASSHLSVAICSWFEVPDPYKMHHVE